MSTPTKSRFELSLLPAVMTAIVFALFAAFALQFSLSLALLCVAPMPIALLLLWRARDVPSAQERIAEVDAARESAPPQPEAAPAGRAHAA